MAMNLGIPMRQQSIDVSPDNLTIYIPSVYRLSDERIKEYSKIGKVVILHNRL